MGHPNAANQGRFGYTGQAWLPELGMWYYKARIYSPTLGRFLQMDPVGYKDDLDLYDYVGNDPVDGRDPTGLSMNCVLAPTPVGGFDCGGDRGNPGAIWDRGHKALPPFKKLWAGHPGAMSVEDVYAKIGRKDAIHWGVANACSVRMCMAFADAGATLNPAGGANFRAHGGHYDGIPMILTVKQFDTT